MSLDQTPTLAELRLRASSLVVRRAQVERSSSLHAKFDEAIRQAFSDLVNAESWAPLRIEETIQLSQGVHGYGIPDGIPPGWIEGAMEVIRSEDNRSFPVYRGISHYDRTHFSIDYNAPDDLTTNASRPEKWDFWDGQIQLYPAPDTTIYSTVRFWAKTKPKAPTADSDRCYVDGDAHVLMALSYYFLVSDPNKAAGLRSAALARLRAIAAQQQPGGGLQLGPARASRFNHDYAPDASVLSKDNWDPYAARIVRRHLRR